MKTLLCLLTGTGLLFGQFDYGEILGTVRDASQAVVSGAKITLTNLDTNVVREAITNEQGDYSFPGHPAVGPRFREAILVFGAPLLPVSRRVV